MHSLDLENKRYTEKVLEEHIDAFNQNDWNNISEHQELSESFIEKYEDKVNWYYISMSQTLSETFIEKHADKISWFLISQYQKFSIPFIKKHFKRICFLSTFLYNNVISKEVKIFVIKKIQYDYLFQD
jgi:hypothetical protein